MPAKKILLPDDADLLTILEGSFFLRDGFDVIPVRAGQECFSAVEAEAPALVVLDAARQRELAVECCRTIKGDSLLAETPVLMLLDEAPVSAEDAGLDSGCDAILTYPLSAERFLDAACALLGIPRRRAQRFPVNFKLAFRDLGQKVHEGFCANLNAGGMFISSPALFPVGTELTLELALPGFCSALEAPVRVAWVNHPEWRKKGTLPCGMGVEFLAPGSTLRAALREFLAEFDTTG